jgi:hypothetical protein
MKEKLERMIEICEQIETFEVRIDSYKHSIFAFLHAFLILDTISLMMN